MALSLRQDPSLLSPYRPENLSLVSLPHSSPSHTSPSRKPLSLPFLTICARRTPKPPPSSPAKNINKELSGRTGSSREPPSAPSPPPSRKTATSAPAQVNASQVKSVQVNEEQELKGATVTQELPTGGWNLKSPVTMGAGVAAALLVAGVTFRLIKSRTETRPVDTLTRRGLLYTDRQEEFRIIQEYDSPTEVRNYQIGDIQLKEVGFLPPLSEEKKRQHREARMREHGWKKLEMVLVEGDQIPEGVDPLAVRFIPRKHPFALNQAEMTEEWSEEVVRRRLKQRRGRPEKDREEARRRLEKYREAEGGGVGAISVKEGLGGVGGGGGGGGGGRVEDAMGKFRIAFTGGQDGKGGGSVGVGAGGLGGRVSSRGVEAAGEEQPSSIGGEGSEGGREEGGAGEAKGERVGLEGSQGSAVVVNGNGVSSSGVNGTLLGSGLGKGVVGRKGGQGTDVGSAFGWSQEFLPPVSDEASKAQQQQQQQEESSDGNKNPSEE